MRFDLHIHSSYSRDGTAPPSAIVRRCRELGLSGIAITDHNEVSGYYEARAAGKSEGVLVVSGTEVSTLDGHVLAYGVREVIPRGMSAAETVDRVRGAGGLAVAAHPIRFPSGVGLKLARELRWDGVEVLNGGSSRIANRSAQKLARDLEAPGTGGSDAHRLGELGRAYTSFENVFTEDQAIDALRKGLLKTGGRNRTLREGVVYSVETTVEWLRGGMRRM
jgi:predicted metal-dependent phosphoesterase TrpH